MNNPNRESQQSRMGITPPRRNTHLEDAIANTNEALDILDRTMSMERQGGEGITRDYRRPNDSERLFMSQQTVDSAIEALMSTRARMTSFVDVTGTLPGLLEDLDLALVCLKSVYVKLLNLPHAK